MLSSVSADFRSAGLEPLERLAAVTPRIVADLVRSRDDVAGAVLLSTCNRFEVYLDLPAAEGRAEVHAAVTAAVAAASGVEPATVAGMLTERTGEDVAEHLFAVSSGLESLVLGEAEIAGQVSRALEVARGAGSTTPGLERLFQRASHTSSAVQHRTRLGGAERSVVRLALDLVESRVADWATASVLLIGTGSYAGTTLRALRGRGAADIGVYSPSGRAGRFAAREGATAVHAEAFADTLARADVVVACSIATTPVVTAEQFADAERMRPRRRVVVDLGLPRNVDPAVAALPGTDLLDLETIGLHAPLPELSATAEARALIREAVDDHRAAQDADAVVPALVALRSRVFDVVDAEIERLRRRGESSEAAERALRHLAGVLVHTPTARAKDLAAAGEAERFLDALALVSGVDPSTEPRGGRTDAVG